MWRDAVKTLFDPCPPGWRVPKSGVGAINPWHSLALDHSFWDQSTPAGWGRFFDGPAMYSGTAWYPVAGDRRFESGRLGEISNGFHIWSATFTGGKNYFFYGNQSQVLENYNGGLLCPAHGFSVRCIRE